MFRIHFRCAYYSQDAHQNQRERTQAEWDAYKFCGAVKNATVNGFLYTRDPRHRIDGSNVRLARAIFGMWMIGVVQDNFANAERLVPVPSKDSWDTDNFRTLEMTRQALGPKNDPSWASPMVRYTQKRSPASQGGPRGYYANLPYLRATKESAIRRVVLVDDIVTGGGNLLATRRRLIDAGLDVLGAVVCGRTTAGQDDPWLAGTIEVDSNAIYLP